MPSSSSSSSRKHRLEDGLLGLLLLLLLPLVSLKIIDIFGGWQVTPSNIFFSFTRFPIEFFKKVKFFWMGYLWAPPVCTAKWAGGGGKELKTGVRKEKVEERQRRKGRRRICRVLNLRRRRRMGRG